MSKISKIGLCGFAALLAYSPAAIAQDSGTNASESTTVTTVRSEDRDFPWGLLGLLGLAGLIPRKQKQPDVVVDARRDTRP